MAEVAEPEMLRVVRAVAARDRAIVSRHLDASPALAVDAFEIGASRGDPSTYYLDEINHYVYVGDTMLHIAPAAHEPALARSLLGMGAAVDARNRRGARPLHYAADGVPGSDAWNPTGQAAV